MVAYAFVARVEFEVGPGMAVPTQLVLVPMLFALPLGVVPACVACGLALRSFLSRQPLRVQLERLPLQLVSSWHAVGPVLVLAAAGERPFSWTHWPVYAAALGAQFVFDYWSAATRQWLALGVRPRAQLGFMAMVYLVDAALAPVGLALAAAGRMWAPLLAAPLVGLLGVFARERQVRIDHALELGHAYRGTALLLGDVVEADDAYTGSHSREVVDLVLAVSDELRLTASDRRTAEFGPAGPARRSPRPRSPGNDSQPSQSNAGDQQARPQRVRAHGGGPPKEGSESGPDRSGASRGGYSEAAGR